MPEGALRLLGVDLHRAACAAKEWPESAGLPVEARAMAAAFIGAAMASTHALKSSSVRRS
eukprot:6214364-Pleurochrysis_carterae.AAC.2